MIEGLLLIILIFFGGLFLIISLITLLIGFVKKSSKLKKFACGIGVVPILCFGILMYWYLIAIPSFNKSQMDDFVGIYVPNDYAQELLTQNGLATNEIKLILFSNGTYKFDTIQGVELEKSGIWKTGGIDGMFEFHNNEGRLIDWGIPSGNDNNSTLSFEYQIDKDDWKNNNRILFIKKSDEKNSQ